MIALSGCDGVSNAWYSDDKVTVCCEYVDDLLKNASDDNLPAGITKTDATLGPLLDVFLHEAGHAVFDMLRIPVFGREEDAADQFSSYIMLRYDKDRARRLILGSAYQYKRDVRQPETKLEITKFANEHGLPAQRFFNVLCVAYGWDPKLFAELVEKKYLPQDRAEFCDGEYEQVRYAFQTLIGPHIDKDQARRFFRKRSKVSIPP